MNQYFEEDLVNDATNISVTAATEPVTSVPKKTVQRSMSNKVTLSQYFERELLEETSASERNRNDSILMYQGDDDDVPVSLENEEEIDIYTSYASYMSSSDPGSDNILVTIDYGSMDMEDELSIDSLGIVEEEPEESLKKMDYLQVPSQNVHMSKIKKERSKESLLKSSESLLRRVLNPFQVHHVQHTDTATNSAISSMNSLREYNVDTSGDYGSWQQQPESEYSGTGTPREYRYEDLIKDERINDGNNYCDDDDGDNVGDIGGDIIINRVEGDDDVDDLVDFSYDVALSARWSSDSVNRYYRSVDYLN